MRIPFNFHYLRSTRMESIYSPRYPGTRWVIIFGSYSGTEQLAVNQLQKLIQRYLPYIIEVLPATGTMDRGNDHMILIGTPENNPHIRALLQQTNLPQVVNPQGYLLACLDSPWHSGSRILLVTGTTAQGILHGVQALGKHLSTTVTARLLTGPEGHPDYRKSFDALPEFVIHESPVIERRGIWCWGYTIHDYRRFLDQMVHLRMNTIIAWNDFPPINAPQFIDYAHERGISVIFGFHWGWGLSNVSLTVPTDRQTIKEIVVEKYLNYYRDLNLDGIYFQTLTEHSKMEENGITTARAACMLVNDTSNALWKIKPDLKIYFGLHATSIQENYTDLVDILPAITIIWEDAGGIPYSYNPILDPIATPEKAREYSKRLATFRSGTQFALVPKGWPYLRWEDEFEHHGPFILGEQDASWIRHRLEERRTEWSRFNALWLQNYPFAARFYREISAIAPNMLATSLIEDSGLEEIIQPSVALLAESIWNPNRSDEIILQEALNPFYQE
jgi:hypothetical protein